MTPTNPALYSSNREWSFYEFLVDKGYPPESIAHQFPLPGSLGQKSARVDFAIIDPRTKDLLALFELEKDPPPNDSETTTERYGALESFASDRGVLLYVVTKPADDFYFHVPRPNLTGRITVLEGAVAPEFDSLVSRKMAQTKSQHRERRDDSLKFLQRTSWGLAGTAAVLAVADFIALECYGTALLTAERLSLIAAVAVLALLPFVQAFKWLGIEWQMAESARRNKPDHTRADDDKRS